MNISILRELGIKEVELGPGATLLEEGAKGTNVYVLISGTVRISAKGQQIAMVDGPGTLLGEIATLMGTEHVATAVTVEPCSFYVIQGFMDFILAHPEACVSVAQVLACRLINMNNHLVAIKEQLASMQESVENYIPVFPENLET